MTTSNGREYRSPNRTAFCLLLVVFLSACSSTHAVQRETVEQESILPIRYSIIYVIHGDGSYLYHDEVGHERRADEEALLGAKAAAKKNVEAEVFIFHEKRRRPLLKRLWSRSDGELFYYRNGRLVAEESYRRSNGSSRFNREVELREQYRSKQATELSRMFLYFGHEIPELASIGYDASYKNRSFTVEDIAEGLKGLRPDSTQFDLVILSTCFNGTPHTISTLAPHARYIVASPDNLHLSFFDSDPLEEMDLNTEIIDMGELARSFAKGSFDRLSRDVQTAITVAVYDVNQAKGYARAVDSMYVGALATMELKALSAVERYDCAENPEYRLPGMLDGVEMYYRPARFGRDKHKEGHSGWECVRLPSNRRDLPGY